MQRVLPLRKKYDLKLNLNREEVPILHSSLGSQQTCFRPHSEFTGALSRKARVGTG